MILRFSLYILFVIAVTIESSGEKLESAHRESIIFQTKRFEESLERAHAFLEDSTLNSFLESIMKKTIEQ